MACGNGNATLAAARRFALATGIDYVPTLLERARQRAQADGLDATFYGPVVKALATLGPVQAAALRAAMVELVKRFDVADDATTVLRMDYLEPIIRKPAA